jgi:predicted LPLAT superfamily acyltransferase
VSLKRFLVRGLFWRQLHRWAVLSVPAWLVPIMIGCWSTIFLLWGPGRRGVMRNLKAIKPGSLGITNFFRCYRVFWNFAWTMTDNLNFKQLNVVPDWLFTGLANFEQMEKGGGAILLTAHMGSYDLGAHLFSQMSKRQIVMVRAPERDVETRAYEEAHQAEGLRVEFNTQATDLAFDLLDRVRNGEIIAIQGDRVTPGIGDFQATLFGKPIRIPAGPFALAMAASVPIYPVFIIRLGYRRYALVACPAIEVTRSRDRQEAFAAAVGSWTKQLESIIGSFWFQWFEFEPFSLEQHP